MAKSFFDKIVVGDESVASAEEAIYNPAVFECALTSLKADDIKLYYTLIAQKYGEAEAKGFIGLLGYCTLSAEVEEYLNSGSIYEVERIFDLASNLGDDVGVSLNGDIEEGL